MITPPFLTQGDKVAIVSTARKISPADVLPAIRIFRGWGLEVLEGKHLYAVHNQFAGSDEERLADLQHALDDENIRAVICSRGGYGTVRIIDRLDFTRFLQNPKWIVGYSDVTVLHSHIHRNFGIETLHAMMPVNFRDLCDSTPPVYTMKRALMGIGLEYEIPHEPLNRKGSCTGLLTGGNLSILYSLAGTVSDIDTRGKVLFLEDVDEYLYHLDRMMRNLKRTGKLDQLAGLIVGSMSKMRDNDIPFGKTPYEIIADSVREYEYPVCYNFPAGHQEDNRALILGREVTLEVSDSVRIHF